MRALILCLLLTACSTGDWGDYNYGPADYLHSKGVGQWDTMYNYEWFTDPEIIVHTSNDMRRDCGTEYAQGCAIAGNPCVVFIRERADPSALPHEQRHCRGWSHYEPHYSYWSLYSQERRDHETLLASRWYPTGEP